MRLFQGQGIDDPQGRRHFFALAARVMRQVLVDHARALARRKRRPPGQRVPLDDLLEGLEREAPDLLALDEDLNVARSFIDGELERFG